MEFKLISIDTGGTFTDIIAIPEKGKPVIMKVASTPENPEKAIIDALVSMKSNEIIHGTTVAINAILQRKGARVALITSKGFKDVIEIARQNRRDIYEIVASRTEPLVPSYLRFEIGERVINDGSVLIPIDITELDKLTEQLLDLTKNNQIEAIAVSFLFSFLNSTHEQLVADKLRDLFKANNIDMPISISSFVFPEYREYDRTSTTVVDAYIKPLVSNYINRLDSVLHDKTNTLAIMKSSKGLAVPEGLTRKPVEILMSGLAGGVQAGELTSRLTGIGNIITLDIGGTSTDVAQISNGRVSERYNFEIEGLPISTRSVDVTTIGAGGGSIADIIGNLLKVGPESAGAVPGPAAYGLGGENVTVTDADLIFGVLSTQLGGGILEMKSELALEVLEKLSERMNSTLAHTVKGVRAIFHENIAQALRNVSTERGIDPREYTLLAFGGAGPVHAVDLAIIMGIKHVLIPPYPGIWSAYGLLGADYRYDSSRAYIRAYEDSDVKEIEDIFNQLKTEILGQIKDDGIADIASPEIFNNIAARYMGQSFELTVEWKNNIDDIRFDFLNKHRKEYGFAAENEPIEIVALRSYVIIAHDDPVLPDLTEMDEPEILEYREVLDYGRVPVVSRDQLGLNYHCIGPLIIDQDDTTTWIPENWEIKVDKLGFMHVQEVLR